MLKGHHPTAYEFRYITRSGEIRWALESVASVLYKGTGTAGQLYGYQRKKLDSQMLIAGKLASIGELAAV
jgi:hypothetical protein